MLYKVEIWAAKSCAAITVQGTAERCAWQTGTGSLSFSECCRRALLCKCTLLTAARLPFDLRNVSRI